MARGKVKKWLAERAKGWIIDDDDGAEVFFGDRDLRGLTPADLLPGLEVEFERGANQRGATARAVRRVGAAGGPTGPVATGGPPVAPARPDRSERRRPPPSADRDDVPARVVPLPAPLRQ